MPRWDFFAVTLAVTFCMATACSDETDNQTPTGIIVTGGGTGGTGTGGSTGGSGAGTAGGGIGGSGAGGGATACSGHLVGDIANPRFLRYEGAGPYFLCGPGDPEDFLYRGTRNADGTRTGDQMDLINKLAPTGANGIYFQAVRSHGGDGPSDHNPFVDSDPANGLDDDILGQWETWLSAMDAAGITSYFIFFDDSACIWDCSSNDVPTEEAAFIQAIVDRFEHHRLITWVIAEEYQEAFSPERASNMAAAIRGADDCNHAIAVHKLSGLSFNEFASDANIDQFSIQFSAANPAGTHTGMVTAFSNAAGQYNLNLSELHDHGTGTSARRHSWAAAMAGAYTMQLGMDIASTPVSDLEDCGRLVDFMESTRFDNLEPRDDLAFGGAQYVLANPNDAFILYAAQLSGDLGVQNIDAGTYDFTWFDAVTGASVDETDVTVAGGAQSWAKPGTIGNELAVWIRQSN